MCRGQWLAGVSDRMLADEWRVTPDAVRKVSAEASRVLRRRLREDPEAQREARAQVLQLFEVIRTKALAKGDAPSLRVALDATRAYGFYMGIEPAKKLDVADRSTPLDDWTLEEKIAYAQTGKRPERRAFSALSGDDGGRGGEIH